MSTAHLDVTRRALDRAVVVLRAMAYEHRIRILVLLQEGDQTPASLVEAMSVDPTLVARHLRYLRDARLIRRKRRGREVTYTLPGEATRRLITEVLRHAENSA
ncbi:metalloregulator ArsR/SmtB family transcription factor [Micromonospora sp. WMMD1120]|uniref:ArsR/SmtB family transcription factor n=1 Tax=Micromonospora sp. WMMD1120 TaxID=3016106 RepID=UPI002416EA9B|nr:metalloregulator ArsR/SmtB family transcription factor [Micromonospora sp. WMMD1120]MDG4811028.1 metalloregulator ArsR/SmtB family transcription factor [Micromonospora sp. WMMD1120]